MQTAAFHHRCIHTVLGITNKQQHITSGMTRHLWGNLDIVADKITRRRLAWLGHIAHTPEHCVPKMALFGWLPKTCPPGGPHKQWRDQICKDLKVVGISESEWYDEATSSREGWCATYCLGLGTSFGPQNQQQESAHQSGTVKCGIYRRSFR